MKRYSKIQREVIIEDYDVYHLSFKEISRIFGQGIVIDIITAFFVYRSIWAFIIGLPLLVLYIKYTINRMLYKRKRELKMQFKDAITILYGIVGTGGSLETVMKRTLDDLQLMYQPTDLIVREFAYISHKLAMNVSLEVCLKDFADRSSDEDIQSFSQIINIAKKSGGSLTHIVKTSVDNINLKIEAEQEILTIITAKKSEFRIMCLVPIGILIYLSVFSSDFLEPVYSSIGGAVVMTICLILYVAAVAWGFRILNIKV